MPIDDKKELFYLVDENDHILRSITREKAHLTPDSIHRAVGIFVHNQNGEMLMQKRSHKKDMEKGKWSNAVGGHVTFGHTYEEAARKELKEELGIEKPLEFLTKALIKTEKEKEYISFYKVKISSAVSLFPDKDEIASLKWVKLNKLKEFIKKHKIASWTFEVLKVTGYL